ncbi:rhodanese-like domain-containing protein [Chromobacterium sp. IIBBL 290-4]|uniref:rhodanese-like domain-containing protein n=1 Tax=Chromobacterium sp. IIBBL 290-4 TaxID=2953890 RepID=UPI0020B6D90C|nr:rhodanese-like domain-containing protein [Chromobacterium sp. IIBBL 290-4]UTH76499.1 rhodanese-like domain-containing protein [Chromobacterium sp. IIBBL 290-4]
MISQEAFYAAKLAYEIDAADVAYALSEGDASLVLVDARSAEAYAHETIPGALSLPHRLMAADSTAHLSRELTYVTFCDGIGCNGSTKGALNLTRLGFKVKELQGGIDWWKRDGYATTRDAGCGKEVCDVC